MSIFYTESHERIRLEGNIASLSVSAYARNELSDIVYIELPEVGREVRKGEAIIVIESVKAASDVYAPVTGKVIEVNQKIEAKPELLSDAEDTWLIKIELSDATEINALLSEEQYQAIIKQQ